MSQSKRGRALPLTEVVDPCSDRCSIGQGGASRRWAEEAKACGQRKATQSLLFVLRLVDAPDTPPPLPRHRAVIDRGPFGLEGDLALMRAHGDLMTTLLPPVRANSAIIRCCTRTK